MASPQPVPSGSPADRDLTSIAEARTLARRAKHGSKTFLRCAKKIEEGSVELARRKHCQAVCCGHTHSAGVSMEQAVHYFNSGCWTELPCHYLTVAHGVVRLHAFETPAPVPVVLVEPATEPLVATALVGATTSAT